MLTVSGCSTNDKRIWAITRFQCERHSDSEQRSHRVFSGCTLSQFHLETTFTCLPSLFSDHSRPEHSYKLGSFTDDRVCWRNVRRNDRDMLWILVANTQLRTRRVCIRVCYSTEEGATDILRNVSLVKPATEPTLRWLV